jgi:hypothetical protein
MEVDDELLEVHDDPELVLIALSAELDAIHELDNIDQLVLLMKECYIMKQHRIIPISEWVEERMIYIYTYRDLDWNYMIQKMNGHNEYLYEACNRVVHAIEELIKRWNHDQFTLDLYHFILNTVHSIWMHYRNTDVESGNAVDDLALTMGQM